MCMVRSSSVSGIRAGKGLRNRRSGLRRWLWSVRRGNTHPSGQIAPGGLQNGRRSHSIGCQTINGLAVDVIEQDIPPIFRANVDVGSASVLRLEPCDGIQDLVRALSG